MKRQILVALFVALAGAAPVTAETTSAGPGPGYFASDNVKWHSIIPLHADSAGARIVGNWMYITTGRDLSIYNVRKPLEPQLTGFLPNIGSFAEEDPDTNGKILLIGTLQNLHVIDVEDKANPRLLAQLPGADDHTFTCVLQCRYAYSSGGRVIDLRDPAQPKVIGEWDARTPHEGGHDVTEVRPGILVTSTHPIQMLDVRQNILRPKVLAMGAAPTHRLVHGNEWPRLGQDRLLLVGGETGGPFCGPTAGAFMTFDASRWRETRTFKFLDEYRVEQGLPTDGNAPVNRFCAHWFDAHPTFHNGGLVAMGWYEHGTRFLDVSSKGKIKEVGYFLPVGGATSAAYWLGNRVVYAVDYDRGIDILEFTGK